ncbi:hypothetical protein BJ742DRAFT_18123 [Cladochytrium replicatum]|nr:hypothetical protein BJ742DRAFT_18123 [Cladochytrium replicatum]
MVGAAAYKKRQPPRVGRFADTSVHEEVEEQPKFKRLRTTDEGFGAKNPMVHSPTASTLLQTPAKTASKTPSVPQSEARKAILDVLEDMAPPTTSLSIGSPAPSQNPYSKSIARGSASQREGSTPLKSLFAKKLAEAQNETSSIPTPSFGGSLFGKKIAEAKESTFGSPAGPFIGSKQPVASQEGATQARKRKDRTEVEPKATPKWGAGFSLRIGETFGKRKPSESSETLNESSSKPDSSTGMDVEDSKISHIPAAEVPTVVKPPSAPLFPSFATPKPPPLPSFAFANNAEQNATPAETDAKWTPSPGLFSITKKPQSVLDEQNKSQTTAAAAAPRFETFKSDQATKTPFFEPFKPPQPVPAATAPHIEPFKAVQAKPAPSFELSRTVDAPANFTKMDVDNPKTEAFVFVLPVATKTEAFRKSEHYADALTALANIADSDLPVFRFDKTSSPQTDGMKSNTIASATSSGFASWWAAGNSDKWKCDVCMVRNDQSATKCVSCEADRPGSTKPTTKAVTSTSSSIGFASLWATENAEKWKCDVCMVRNVKSAAKCISCDADQPASESSKDTPSTSATAPKPGASSTPLATNAFASLWAKQNAGKWECSVCMVRNEQSANQCVSCESERPGTTGSGGQPTSASSAPKKTTSMAANIIAEAAAALSGGLEKWTCSTCLVKNSADAKACVACGVDKP